MEKHPTLLRVMTPFPQCIVPEASLEQAEAMMAAHGIHHLPVKEEHGDLIGMLTAADLAIARLFRPRDPRPLTAAELCRRDLYVVDITQSLAAAAREMAARHIGYVLVRRDDHLVGIVTMTDLCLLVAELIDPEIDDIIA